MVFYSLFIWDVAFDWSIPLRIIFIKRQVGLGIFGNVWQIGDRFVKRWNCAVGQTAANVLLGDRYFLCGGIYEY